MERQVTESGLPPLPEPDMQIFRIRLPEKLSPQTFTGCRFVWQPLNAIRALRLEPLIDGPIFGELEPAPTASLEMLDQTLTDIPVDLPAGPVWVSNREVRLPAAQLLVDLANEFRYRLPGDCTCPLLHHRWQASLYAAGWPATYC